MPQFRRFSHRVAKKHGANTGRVAVARAMLKTIYAMLIRDADEAGGVSPDGEGDHRSAPWGHGRLTARGEPDPQGLMARPASHFILGLEPASVIDYRVL